MKVLRLLVIAITVSSAASACDLCSVYASLQAKGSAKGWFGGAFEQYTHFGTLQLDGDEVPNPLDQHLDSSITQLFAGYQFSDAFGVQANLPYVHRAFRRAAPAGQSLGPLPEGESVENGTETGLGDSELLAHWRPVFAIRVDTVFALTVLGGVKLPTGSSDRIAEELEEGSEEDGVPSGIHGHDLALGSGSVDGIVGLSAFLDHKRLVANASVQYSLRTTGDFDYRYANDLSWSFAPGYYFSLEHENTLSVALVLSGEQKGQDTLAGNKTDDTAISAVYLGPQLSYSRGSNLYAEAAADFPLRQNNAALQAVPDYRVRLAVTWRP